MSKLSKLGTVLNGKTIPKNEGVYPAYGGNGIICNVDQYNYPENTIIIGRVGAYCGSVHFSPTKCWVTDNALAFVVSDNDPYFVYCLLRMLQLNRFHIGSSQPLITQGIINNIEFGYTEDVDEQRQISNLIKVLDDKIANNNAICSNLEAMAKLLYDYWFVQFDFPDENGKPYKSSGGKMVWNDELKREIPAGWEVKHASDLTTVRTGKEDANFATINGPYAYFTCGQDVLKCDTPAFEGRAVLLAGNGDFNVKHYTGKFNAYQRTYVLIPEEEKYYALLYIVTKEAITRFTRGSAGSIVKFITLGDVTGIALLDPKNDDMLAKFNLIMDRIEQVQEENQHLVSLRDFLLPMLMNGQVRVGA